MTISGMRISAVIPTYNHASYIASAIESVLSQTVGVDEIIVVDDGSTDETVQVVRRFSERIRYIFQPNAGLSAARNTGIRLATGNWLAFLDADDFWSPNKIELQLVALTQSPEAVLCYGGVVLHDVTLCVNTAVSATAPQKIWPLLRFKNCITGSGSAVLVRKDVVLEAGGFAESLTACEDWDLWVRLARQHPFTAVSDPVVTLRVRPASLSASTERMLTNVELLMEKTLLSDLTGLRRAIWARRIRSWALYSHSWTEPDVDRRKMMVTQSLLQWPSPFFAPRRFVTLLYNLGALHWKMKKSQQNNNHKLNGDVF